MQTEDVKNDVDVCIREASIKQVYTLYTDQDKSVSPNGCLRKFKLVAQ